jgi:hypothetical protein
MAPEFGKPIHHLQLIQADILKKHCVHEPLDKRFPVRRLPASSALARRPGSADRQLWQLCKRRKLGCRISEAAATGDGNFLMPEIAIPPRRETAYREIGALSDFEC